LTTVAVFGDAWGPPVVIEVASVAELKASTVHL
jgi:hypothetical protein